MSAVPTGTELVRPFLPAKDFDLSKRFYETLGFDKILDSDVAIFKAGSGGFILQRYYQKDWAENFMMQLMVDDLDAWWEHINTLDLPGTFGVSPPKPPAISHGGFGLRTWWIRAACCGTLRSAAKAPYKTSERRVSSNKPYLDSSVK